MAETTKIEWASATMNPWIGCTKVSAGCKNCYAEKTTRARVLRSKGQETWGRGAARSRTSEAYWKQPLAWNKVVGRCYCEKCAKEYAPVTWEGVPEIRAFACTACGGKLIFERARVFPSLCDWLDDEIPIEWLADFLRLIYETPNLDWLLLTKRPENFWKRIGNVINLPCSESYYNWLHSFRYTGVKNVWLGVSVENQEMADKRIPELLKIPARVNFVSAEPLLGPLEFLGSWLSVGGIDWVIFGGESGAGARPCNVEWIRDGVWQCKEAGAAAFVKQLGRDPVWSDKDITEKWYERFSDKKGGDPSEWPRDLRVREFPKL